jgi:hypothetical protein
MNEIEFLLFSAFELLGSVRDGLRCNSYGG